MMSHLQMLSKSFIFFFFKLAKITSIKSHIDAVYTLTKT